MLQRAIVLCLVAVAVCMDLKKEKVSNEWILCGWAVGSFWQIWSGGIRGLAVFFLGALLPLTILFLLYYLRMLGGGRPKTFVSRRRNHRTKENFGLYAL